MSEIKKSIVAKRRLEGVVVSAAMPKTRVVLVERLQAHQKYGKRFHTSRRYAVHDEHDLTHLGDRVVIEQTRPLSRTKRWRVLSKVNS